MKHLSFSRLALHVHELQQTSPIESCLRCGRLLVKSELEFTISCVEGRTVAARVCYRCVRAGRAGVLPHADNTVMEVAA